MTTPTDRIQHSTATDPNIHEPKGVATATTGKVYVADGASSGAWANLDVTQLNFTPVTVIDLTDGITGVVTDDTVEDISSLTSKDGSGLVQATDDTLSDISFSTTWTSSQANTINKNFKELFELYEEQVAINALIKKDVAELTTKLIELQAALRATDLIA